MIRVLIADDQKTVRQMLRLFLEREPDIEVVAVAADGRDALDKIETLRPDVALVDLDMPEISGLEAIRTVKQSFPATNVLAISTHDREDYISQVLQAGAKGYLLKTTPAEEFTNAVRSAYKGYVQLGPGLLEKLAAGDSLAPMGDSSALAVVDAAALAAKAPSTSLDRFDQPVVLRQSPVWSRWILRAIVGIAAGGILWASFAKIESAVPAAGKLEPSGTVQNIQVPVPGVVERVYVEEGQTVKAGDLLVRLDATVSTSQQESFSEVMHGLEQTNQVLQALLADTTAQPDWTFEQRSMLIASRTEFQSRVSAAELQVLQLEQQLAQNAVQQKSTRDILAIQEQILNDIKPLFEAGGLSRIQYLRQQQDVQTNQAELARLNEAQAELQFAIAQARQQVTNARSEFQRAWLERMRDNDRQLTELSSQLTQAEQNMEYEEVRAPIDGAVFDLQVIRPGAVVNASEPIMQIVPSDRYVARVFITNSDIGFVHTGMPVDVRVDSFPFSEFGDIKGQLVHIGSDALPPDEIRPFFSFPAEVELNEQVLQANGNQFELQSGMSVTANIRLRKRTVMSIFTDLFSRQVDSLRTVR
ncbi:HlyD family type I secretion periplasmic adaptor subunit [Synechococcus sp. PCC 7336]|uniref:HlyD family type I secretion periplasmic adaptor subunit n=1 Tax=Synechococcus sp. PCC 7336 TaxID=195250 RepID=UPI00034533BB|nr:HlyD family type I secretion periplasmic adaptor subunit [Synechococcus sp. PCC 7336]